MSGLVIHVPHASTTVPSGFVDQFLLSEKEIQAEAHISADLYTDLLAEAVWPDATHIVAPVSRIVCDVERYAEDADEVMARVGRGMIYTHTHQGEAMRRALSPGERKSIHQEIYEPHWNMLRAAAKGQVLIDLHSYPADAWPIEDGLGSHRPEIDLGFTDDVTPHEWVEALEQHFEGAGYDVGINTPYAGVIDVGAKAAVMLEIRRDVVGEPGSAEWERLVSVLRDMPIYDDASLAADARRST